MMIRTILPLLSGLALVAATRPAVGQELNPEAVYRVDPNSQELVETPADEVKPGYIYKHYHERLGRHVWSFAKQGGGFLHVFGPGSRMPTDRFDLRISGSDARALIEERIPGLSKSLERLGQDILLQLNAEDRWQLYPSASVAKLYDLETLRRWEWHGTRRVAVLHTYGAQWNYLDGRYVPASMAGPFAVGRPCCP